MGSTTKVKVAEIFTQAGAAFSRLGELTMQLQSAADDGTPKWTDEEIDMLNIAITRFCSDLTEISLRVKQRGISQLKQTLKKKIYEDAGVPVKQITLTAVPHSGPPPIVLGTADLLQPQQHQHFVPLQHQQHQQQQQQHHHHILQPHQLQPQQIHQFLPQQPPHQQQQQQHQPQHVQQMQIIQAQQHPQQHLQQQQLPQQLLQQQQQPQHIFMSHIPTGTVVIQQPPPPPQQQQQQQHQPKPQHQQQLANNTSNAIIVSAPQSRLDGSSNSILTTSSTDHRNAMMLTLNRLNTATDVAPSSLLDSATVVQLDDDDDDGNGNASHGRINAPLSADGSSSISDDTDVVLPTDEMTEQLKCAFDAVVGSDEDMKTTSP